MGHTRLLGDVDSKLSWGCPCSGDGSWARIECRPWTLPACGRARDGTADKSTSSLSSCFIITRKSKTVLQFQPICTLWQTHTSCCLTTTVALLVSLLPSFCSAFTFLCLLHQPSNARTTLPAAIPRQVSPLPAHLPMQCMIFKHIAIQPEKVQFI